MDGGRAASDAVMASSGAHQVAGAADIRPTFGSTPPRGEFLCFFLSSLKERRLKKIKNIERFNRSDEPRQICVGTLTAIKR